MKNTYFSNYIKSLTTDEQISFADRVGSSVSYLVNQVANGHKRIGPEFALKLEAESAGALKAELLCPDFNWSAAAGGGRCGCPTSSAQTKTT